MLSSSEIERLLVVTAHPDDVDFGSAGTIANMTDDGVEVVYCLVTDGQAGGFDHSIPRDEMAMIRREEQTKAAAEVGVTELHFLGYMDGTVEATMKLRHDISCVIRQVRPQVVITHSPIRSLDSTYGSHPDHTATGEAAMCAVYPDARNPFAFPGMPCAELADWCGDHIFDMYYDADCGELLANEPQWEEDDDGHMIDPSPYYEVSRNDIKKAVFGRELANYI